MNSRTQRRGGRRRPFKAFISYSQAADGRLAPALQTGLQQFAKPWYRLRAMRVFRDSTGLSTTPALWDSIQRALEASEYFILLASPAAAESSWVAREVDWWLDHRSPAHLLIVLTEGELTWNNAAGDFDWTATNALPRRLEGVFTQEPLYLDLRWARSRTDLSLRQPTFAGAIARLVATLRGRSLDELIGEDVQQHARTIRLLRTAVIVLLSLTTLATITAVIAIRTRNVASRLARDQAQVQRAQADQLLSQRIAAFALNETADMELAILAAAEAARIHPTPEAESALRRTLAASVEPSLTVSENAGRINYAVFSPDGRRLLMWGDETARICDPDTGRPLKKLSGHSKAILHAGFGVAGRRAFTAGEDDSVRLWDVASGNQVMELSHPGVEAALLSPDEKRILTLARGASQAILWDVATGRRIAELEYDVSHLSLPNHVPEAAFHPRGDSVAICARPGPVLVDAATGRTLFRMEGDARAARSIDFSPDGNWLITASEDGAVRKWRAADGVLEATLTQEASAADAALLDARFSPSGRWIAARTARREVVLWEATSGRRVTRIEVPEEGTLFAPVIYEFSPNGACLLTADLGEGPARLWETATGKPLGQLVQPDGEKRSVDFRPGTGTVVIGNIFAPARIYQCDVCGAIDELMAAAARRVPRELTDDERVKIGLVGK